MKRLLLLSLFFILSVTALFPAPLAVYLAGKEINPVTMSQDLSGYVKQNQLAVTAALIVGKDRIAVGVTEDEFKEVMLQPKGKKWNSISEKLPSPANIDDIDFIYLFLPSISKPATDSRIYSFQELRDSAEFLGRAEKNGMIIWKYKLLNGVFK